MVVVVVVGQLLPPKELYLIGLGWDLHVDLVLKVSSDFNMHLSWEPLLFSPFLKKSVISFFAPFNELFMKRQSFLKTIFKA